MSNVARLASAITHAAVAQTFESTEAVPGSWHWVPAWQGAPESVWKDHGKVVWLLGSAFWLRFRNTSEIMARTIARQTASETYGWPDREEVAG